MNKYSVIWFVSHLRFQYLIDQVIWWDPCCATRFATGWVFLPLAQFYSIHRGLWFCSFTRWVFCSSSSSFSPSQILLSMAWAPSVAYCLHLALPAHDTSSRCLGGSVPENILKHDGARDPFLRAWKTVNEACCFHAKDSCKHTFISIDAKLMTVIFHFFAFLW